MSIEERKFNINRIIHDGIVDVERSIEDVVFISNELAKEAEKLIGVKPDIDSEPITLDFNNEQNLSMFYESAIRFINCLDQERALVKESYDKIILLEKERAALSGEC